MAYTHGILTTGAGSYGYVQSISNSVSGKNLVIEDEDGITRVDEYYDEKNTANVEAKFDRAQTLPSRGDTITLASSPLASMDGTYTVSELSVNETQNDAAVLSMTLVRYVDGALPTT